MNLAKNVVTAVLHNKNLKYLKSFQDSVNFECNYNFHVLIFCDRIKQKFYNKKNITFINLKKRTFAEVRKYLIDYVLKKNYKKIIFCDLEDFFSNNRIPYIIKNLKKNDIVINDINILEKKKIIAKNVFSKELRNKRLDIKLILEKNFFGFCNTGVKVKHLKKIFIPKNVIAVDWWIYSILLNANLKAKFLSNVFTNYRIDNNNIIGLNKKDLVKKIHLILEIKYIHYINMIRYCGLKKFKNMRIKYDEELNYIKISKFF